MTPDPAHLNDDQLTLIYFDEAAASERLHLASCAHCQSQLRSLSHFLDAIRAVPVPERPADWEGRLWTNLAPRVTETLARPRRTLSRNWFRPWLLAPAFAALLTVVFLAGMYTQHRLAPLPGSTAKARERVLLIALGDHFDRSQIVLAELMNAPGGRSIDISEQQHLAQQLLPENRLLRQTALRSGERADAGLLDQLERVLVEVAHSPSEISSPQLDALRQRIEAQGLLFKVRVISSNAREKGKTL